MGSEHVIEWLNDRVARPLSPSDHLSNDDLDPENEDLADPDRAETSGDIVSVPEVDEHGARIDQVRRRSSPTFVTNRSVGVRIWR